MKEDRQKGRKGGQIEGRKAKELRKEGRQKN